MREINASSCGTLPEIPLVSPMYFCDQRTLHAIASPSAMRNLTNVFVREAKSSGDRRYNSANPRGMRKLCLDSCKIHGVNPPSTERPKYLVADKYVKEKIRKRIEEETRPEIGRRISQFRKERKLTQAALAERFGVRQSAVARWEKGTDRPSTKALLLISELVAENERQWWRDQIAEQNGLGSTGNTTLEIFGAITDGVTIPLISNPKRVGSLGTIPASDVELQFSLPHSWFKDGGAIQAARVSATSFSPLIDGEVIALIDASQKDPDRLVGSTVAVQTVNGIEIRKLHRDRKTYILLPLHEGHGDVSLWRPAGENSIVGKVVRWISEPAKLRK